MRHSNTATADPTVSALKLDTMVITSRSREESGGHINRTSMSTAIIKSTLVSSSVKPATTGSPAANQSGRCSADDNRLQKHQSSPKERASNATVDVKTKSQALSTVEAALKLASPRSAIPPPASECVTMGISCGPDACSHCACAPMPC